VGEVVLAQEAGVLVRVVERAHRGMTRALLELAREYLGVGVVLVIGVCPTEA
jgi:hypothetical protein